MSMAVWSNTAGIIWQATKRFQIRVYSLTRSSISRASRLPGVANISLRTVSGSKRVDVGRMASWASWALFLVLYTLGSAGTQSPP